MRHIIDDSQLIARFNEEMGGVFTLPDLRNIFGVPQDNRFYRRIHHLEKAGILSKYIRGFYITPDCKLDVLSQKICNKSYISFETVLEKNLMIGTVPQKEIKAVKVGKKRIYDSMGFRIIHLSIIEDLFFGMTVINGVNYGIPEKALLDTLYFYTKGQKYYFDIYSDINIQSINTDLLFKYLQRYKNCRFKDFVRNYINENTIS